MALKLDYVSTARDIVSIFSPSEAYHPVKLYAVKKFGLHYSFWLGCPIPGPKPKIISNADSYVLSLSVTPAEESEIDANTATNLTQSTTHFSWLKPYLAKRSTIASLPSLTQDLCQVNRPLLPIGSSLPRGRMDMHKSSKKIKKRTNEINTFNVNRKMPSQALSACIQGSTPFSPPIAKIMANVSWGNSKPVRLE
ncbi:hypothetical protein BYT27DRAFT_7216782 [Phlegmacium glaucopus]|nr:hypothetical protein BYT27DRAFT_7216782 [Phlegmacium glaucopus]